MRNVLGDVTHVVTAPETVPDGNAWTPVPTTTVSAQLGLADVQWLHLRLHLPPLVTTGLASVSTTLLFSIKISASLIVASTLLLARAARFTTIDFISVTNRITAIDVSFATFIIVVVTIIIVIVVISLFLSLFISVIAIVNAIFIVVLVVIVILWSLSCKKPLHALANLGMDHSGRKVPKNPL